MPGAGFQRWARNAKQSFLKMTREPFEEVKADMLLGCATPSFVKHALQNLSLDRPEDIEDVIQCAAGSLFSAGTETLVSAILTFFALIAHHPEDQVHAFDEIRSQIGGDRLPQVEDVNILPYVGCIIQEVYRFNPAIPLVAHSNIKEEQYDGFRVPCRSWLIANVWAMLHDPSAYKDPEVFRPERFLESSGVQDPRTFVFGRCPGVHFADTVLFLVVSRVLALFEIMPEESSPLPIQFSTGLVPTPIPFRVYFKPRKDAKNLFASLTESRYFDCMIEMLWTLVFLLVVIIRVSSSRRNSFILRLPVAPHAERIWGHERLVFKREPGQAFREWVSVLGRTFRIRAAFGVCLPLVIRKILLMNSAKARDILVLSDPEGIAHILQRRIYDYHHSPVVRPRVARLLGKGLGWVEGEFEHKRMRRLVVPSLSSEGIKAVSQEVQEAASRTLADLISVVQDEGKELKVNIVDWTGRATLNVIGRVAFLHDFEGGNSHDASRILNARKQGSSAIAKYAGFLTLMLLRRFPILNDLPVSALQGQGLAKRIVQAEVANKLIERNKPFLDKDWREKQNDLLTRLLYAESEGQISRQELFEQISTFIISGHETTTQTLAFTIWELARHPEVQQRLRTEVESFSKQPTYEDFQTRLPYLDSILRETLRLYPGLAYMERVATKPDEIPLRFSVKLSDGKISDVVKVEVGQTVIIPIIAIHRSGLVWKDPDEFIPERWLEEFPPAESLCSGWANLLAFSDGPRNCIGMRLAIFQYKVILSSLISRFSFEDAGEDISLKISSSLQAWVVGKEHEGPQLPVVLHLL
ncbi:hypothetical protein ACEPAG_5804 [Sanghuangporus baumii]